MRRRRSHNAYIDYSTRGQSYELQHDDFHNTDVPNKFLAYGALVGGPQADDTCVRLPSCCKQRPACWLHPSSQSAEYKLCAKASHASKHATQRASHARVRHPRQCPATDLWGCVSMRAARISSFSCEFCAA